jgi:hypothetical protein
MAISNLTSQYVSASFSGLMQYSSSNNVYDGVGNQITQLNITALGNTPLNTASFALTSSNIFTGPQTMNSGLTVLGQTDLDSLRATFITSSFIYSSGSNQFGDSTIYTQSLIGTVNISGSLTVTGPAVINDLTGSLFGTASWAVTSSHSLTSVSASHSLTNISSSYAISASYADFANTASFALTASFAPNSQPAGLDTYIQFNQSNVFSGSANFTFNYNSSSVNLGQAVLATGQNSLAQGNASAASGINSHAEGLQTTASDTGSHAEGQNTIASGVISHAEGRSTQATGIAAHAEGWFTQATGLGSHAEGDQTIASATQSHAEGFDTRALGPGYSHAEGYSTRAVGNSAHAEGLFTTASGWYSHAEGQYSQATGLGSHAIGTYTVARGDASFAAGNATVASGSNQTVVGAYNKHNDTTSYFIVGIGTGPLSQRRDGFKVTHSGSIAIPTTSSVAPNWTGSDGEIVPATVGGVHRLYMWMAGAWRSSSFA